MSEESFFPTLSQTNRQPWGKLVSCLPTLNSEVLDKDCIRIGRAEGCDIIIDRNKTLLNDTGISKEHCVLTRDATSGNTYITDLSKNGTFLNGVKIGKDKRSILKDNDQIAVIKDANVYIFQAISLDLEELPDTYTSSSESPMLMKNVSIPAWGRLFPCLLYLHSFDLCSSTFKVGRSSQCDAVIDRMEIDPNIKKRFSKEHFEITKSSDSPIVIITDLSKGGTYLNGRLIGKKKRNILQHDDKISIGSRRTKVYVYKSMSPSNANYLPPELKNKYEVSNLLGKGGCGEVRLAFEKRTCKMYAIKKIHKARSTASQMHKLNHPSKIQTEVKILESLSHPFVINMKEIVETDDEVFLVLEYMRGGELNNRILSNVTLTESNVKFLFYQMVLAVQFLHAKGITHRDLKPENVLLSSDDLETIIKVTDFGLSKITEEDDMMKTVCGTLCYIAPEVLNAKIPEYDKQVDVWSLGVILFYMLSKKLPFSSPDRTALGKLIITGDYDMGNLSWNGVSYLAKDLVKRMLTVNPEKRITISAILSHPWLAKDLTMLYRVQLLLEEQKVSDNNEEADDSSEIMPPSKRARLSCSDESV
ncbi:ovarian-specific serine/threonine-protein kinase Lok-like isoform X1 [Anoplophora glabripennis]|uniref:ovarian-specific serine/threonine-protein kinase Lok-like isoform X1 n=1 Tax=Anoplophora glabripennis TaxID=217634 RepID=UPI0008739437|nr:ovarian-specific serine/threonine-protein kinase Lok-like isoform X1 [Anoplophora glabripennis]